MKLSFIKKRTISEGLAIFLLYISFCFSSWYAQRGIFAVNSGEMFGVTGSLFNNDIFAFLSAGVMPTIFYELFTRLFARSFIYSLGECSNDLKYSLRFFFMAANFSIFFLTLLYFINPIISVYGSILGEFLLLAFFLAMYCIFVCKNYLEKYQYAAVLRFVGLVFVVINLVNVSVSIFTELI